MSLGNVRCCAIRCLSLVINLTRSNVDLTSMKISTDVVVEVIFKPQCSDYTNLFPLQLLFKSMSSPGHLNAARGLRFLAKI